MPTEGLVSVYTSFDVTAALLLVDILQERGLAAQLLETGPGGGPYGGRTESRVQVLTEDLREREAEIAAAIQEMEEELYGPQAEPPAGDHS
ncbi:MAG TPA: hypothetical protein VGM19_05300 [Armatimonadota bacterium]|jgi:hypothetical protein